jgi:hypothetical protein
MTAAGYVECEAGRTDGSVVVLPRVRICLPGWHVWVGFGFIGLRTGVQHGPAEREEGAENEQKI